MMWLLIFIVSVVLLGVSRFLRISTFWKQQGIPFVAPLPVFGNHLKYSLGLKSFAEVIDDLYKKFSKESHFGIFLNAQPALVLRDPALIAALEQDQGRFCSISSTVTLSTTHGNSSTQAGGLTLPTTAKNALPADKISALQADAYRAACRSADHFVEYFMQKGNNTVAIDARHMCERFVSGVILGIVAKQETNVFLKRNNDIFKYYQTSLNQGASDLNTITNFGKNLNILKTNNTSQLVEHCGDSWIKSQMTHLFENVASTASFVMYEMSINSQMQAQLQCEIDKACNASMTNNNNNEQFTVEVITELQYLQQILKETVRKWPKSPASTKSCTKDTELTSSKQEKPLKIKKDTLIVIPQMAVQRDSEIFSNPDRFDPERSYAKNVDVLQSLGSDNLCTQLSLMMIGVFVFHVLKRFNTVAISKTQMPLELSRSGCQVKGKDGIWVGLQRRRKMSLF